MPRKHLHGRGEDYKRSFDGSQLWRNTSTDVEKTSFTSARNSLARKHLHGRGEDTMVICMYGLGEETPPRTWRRRRHHTEPHLVQGNTSTDVEKTILAAVQIHGV